MININDKCIYLNNKEDSLETLPIEKYIKYMFNSKNSFGLYHVFKIKKNYLTSVARYYKRNIMYNKINTRNIYNEK